MPAFELSVNGGRQEPAQDPMLKQNEIIYKSVTGLELCDILITYHRTN